jgi:hypothetical protein
MWVGVYIVAIKLHYLKDELTIKDTSEAFKIIFFFLEKFFLMLKYRTTVDAIGGKWNYERLAKTKSAFVS